MPAPLAETHPGRRPSIIVCVFERADPADPVWADIFADGWAPPGANVRSIGPGDPMALAGILAGGLDDADCRAVLLVGRTRHSDGFRIQMRAENRALVGGAKVSRTGPATARTTAPVAEMVRALNDAGLVTDATSHCEEDAGSYLLYRVLTALPDAPDAPAVGLLRVPMSIGPAALTTGLRTATSAMARHLGALPRSRLS